ncbi:MAG: hypothetical protein ABL888_20015 [Pirellulaceae bacterium]
MHDFGIFQNSFDPKATVDPPEPEEIDPRLAFLEPDPEPAALRPWSQFDEVAQSWSEIGVPIAIDFRDRVQSMNYGKAVNEFRKYETDRLADALEEAGLKFNRKELLDALLWKSVTERERDADIGNLPRVLLALGLKGSIANFFKQDGDQEIPVDEAAGDSDDDGEYEEEDSGEFAEYDLEQEDGEDDWEDEYDGEDEISEEDQREIEEAESRMQEMMQEAERGRQKDKGPSKSDQSKEPWGPDTFLSATLQAAQAHDLLPVAGEPVELNVGEIALLGFFASAIDAGQTLPALLTCFPPAEIEAAKMNVHDTKDSNMEVRPAKAGWHLALRSLEFIETEGFVDDGGDDYLATCVGTDLASLVREPPDGTQIEVSSADANRPELCLRFAGPVTRGKLQITEAFPQINHDSLSEAVSLARENEQYKYVLSGPDESEAVMQAVSRDLYLHNMGVVRTATRSAANTTEWVSLPG